MSITSQADVLIRGLQVENLLRESPIRVAEIVRITGQEMRTVQRVLADLRRVGAWRREHGLPWYELRVEIRGAERWHSLADHPAERPKRDARR